jgi:CBS domain-containing protein
MTKAVAALRVSDRLTDAITLLLREQTSGAPVVNDGGVCVGVFSATDVLNFHNRAGQLSAPKRRACFDTWNAGADWWRDFGRVSEQIGPQLHKSVAEFMTQDVVSVTEETPLATIIQYMVDAHVHRVLVLDSSRRLKGIVTTMDVLAAVLRAARRAEPIAAGA